MGKPLAIVSTVVALAIAPAAQGARTTSTTTRALRPGVSVEQPELYRGETTRRRGRGRAMADQLPLPLTRTHPPLRVYADAVGAVEAEPAGRWPRASPTSRSARPSGCSGQAGSGARPGLADAGRAC
jgi:hypothetical protein